MRANWVAWSQYWDEYEMYYMIDQYVDYHAMFVNPQGVKAVLDAEKGNMGDDLSFNKVNQDFQSKRQAILKGEKIQVSKDANEAIKKAMAKMKQKIVEAREGFINVDESGQEVFVQGRKFSAGKS